MERIFEKEKIIMGRIFEKEKTIMERIFEKEKGDFRRMKTEPYCKGHIHEKCERCKECLPDIITGNNMNRLCEHYDPMVLHIFEKSHSRQESLYPKLQNNLTVVPADNPVKNGLQRFKDKYGNEWRK